MKIYEICEYGKKSNIKAGEGLKDGYYKFFTSSSDANKYVNKKQFTRPGIIMGTGGNVTLHYCDEPFSVSTDCLVLFPKIKVSAKYLYYFFKGNFHLLQVGFKGAGLKHTSKKYVDEISLKHIPDEEEQKLIVEILDKLTDTINKKSQQLTQYDQLIKSQFIEIFGDLNQNSKNWVTDRLENHLNVIGGYAFKSSNFSENGIPVLRIGNINSGIFIPKDLKYWVYDSNLDRYIVLPGDLIISLTGTVGKDDYGNVCIMGDDYPKYYLNQRNAKLKLLNTLNTSFLMYSLKIPEIKNKLTGISRGVRQANISNKDILQLELPIPPVSIQNEFSEFVKQIDKLKFIVQKSLEETQTLFDSSMQIFFSIE